MSSDEKQVGQTAEGEPVYEGPQPGSMRATWYYTKDSRKRYAVSVREIRFFGTEGEQLEVCSLCKKEGHTAQDCHIRGGTEHDRNLHR